jgi:hypothetical protein
MKRRRGNRSFSKKVSRILDITEISAIVAAVGVCGGKVLSKTQNQNSNFKLHRNACELDEEEFRW